MTSVSRKFRLTVKREIHEWIVIDVEASTPGQARQKAFRQCRDNPEIFDSGDDQIFPAEVVKVEER